MVLAAALLPYLATAYAKFSDGGGATYDNRAPRAQLENLPARRRRAHWAQLNGFEAFAPFAAGVIIAHLCGTTQGVIDGLAVAFVTLRLIYTACYIGDQPTARSIVWFAGLGCVVALFVTAAR
jgi:uncharacterized MAPEG superfamily protein